MRIQSRPLVFACVALGALAPSRVAFAVWPEFGRAICNAPAGQQHPVITTDGAGGAIIAWQDFRFPRVNIFVQHVLATGEVDPAWAVNGRAALNDPAAMANADGGQTFPLIASDGAGGAIVVWQDLRNPVTEIDIFAQHVLPSGVVDPAWPANGRALCEIVGLQIIPSVTLDGEGGAIVAWMDTRSGPNNFDIFAQHVLVSGVLDPRWPANGIAVSTAPGPQQFPVIVDDGAGGAVIAWFEERGGPLALDIFAQRILNSGAVAPGWPVNGRALCTADGGQANPTIVSDGANGAIVAWTDARSPLGPHIFAQHVIGSGAVDPAWPVDGRVISNAVISEVRPLAVSDGAGGAVVTWQGFNGQPNITNMFAQHVLATGVVDPAWPAGGSTLSFRLKLQSHAEIASDGAGGAFVTWNENSQDVSAQHVLASGALDPAFPADGRVLVNLPSQQGDPAIVATAGGGAIVTWADTRSGVDVDIFAIQVLEARPTDVPNFAPPGITFAPAFPNPARGSLTLRFVLPHETQFSLSIYDVAGRRVRELAAGARPAGEHALAWDMRDQGGREVSAGVYFARLDADRQSVSQKLVKLK